CSRWSWLQPPAGTGSLVLSRREATVSPRGGESRTAGPEVRIQGAEVGTPGELVGELRLVVIDAPQQLAQLGDPVLGAGAPPAQHSREPGADRLVRAPQVAGGQIPDLGHGQPEPPQGTDHTHAPQRFVVEEPVVPRASPHRVDQAEILVLPQRLDR